MSKRFEHRTVPADVEVRAGSAPHLRVIAGHASVFGVETTIGGAFREQVGPVAFNKTLADGPDTRYLANHEGLTLARTKNGTLKLSVDDSGLYSEAEFDTRRHDANDLALAAERGDMDGMSFAFRTIHDTWNKTPEDGGLPQRMLDEVSLNDGDVSTVNYPAYSGTDSVMLREARAVMAEHGIEPPLTTDEMTFAQVLEVITRSTPEGWDGDPEEIRAAIASLEAFVVEPTTEPVIEAPAGHSLELAKRLHQVSRNRARLLGVA